jgi:hypothetical protein
MKRILVAAMIAVLAVVQTSLATLRVQIIHASGDVKIRRGVAETWQPASAGTWLENIDSIFTGEGGEAVLRLPDGNAFRLGANAILDVADLRRITEEELFLILMSTKIQSIPRDEKTKLRIGNIHVVHGERRTGQIAGQPEADLPNWQFEKNGAIALFSHDFMTNSIVKLKAIRSGYPEVNDCGEIQLYLGRAFEALQKAGQAIDAYRLVVEQACESPESHKWSVEAEDAIKRLKR